MRATAIYAPVIRRLAVFLTKTGFAAFPAAIANLVNIGNIFADIAITDNIFKRLRFTRLSHGGSLFLLTKTGFVAFPAAITNLVNIGNIFADIAITDNIFKLRFTRLSYGGSLFS